MNSKVVNARWWLRRRKAALTVKWTVFRTRWVPVSAQRHYNASAAAARVADSLREQLAAKEREYDEKLAPLLRQLVRLTTAQRGTGSPIIASVEIDSRILMESYHDPSARRYMAMSVARYVERTLTDALVVPSPRMPHSYDDYQLEWQRSPVG